MLLFSSSITKFPKHFHFQKGFLWVIQKHYLISRSAMIAYQWWITSWKSGSLANFSWLHREKDLSPDYTFSAESCQISHCPIVNRNTVDDPWCVVKCFCKLICGLHFLDYRNDFVQYFFLCGFGVKNYDQFLRLPLWVFHAVISRTSFCNFPGNWFLVTWIQIHYMTSKHQSAIRTHDHFNQSLQPLMEHCSKLSKTRIRWLFTC